jgi:tRNA dimethylallyltransferase
VAVALVGPTASGKSEIALAAARIARAGGIPVELVSVDSMAVYRGMDIGTAKPPAAVRAEFAYHLLDLVDPEEEYTVTRFQADARSALEGIAARGAVALLVGGTGLYLRAVTDDLTFPGRFPEVAQGLTAELDALGPAGSTTRAEGCAGLHARLATVDPPAAARIEPGNERRLVRALEVTLGSGRPFSSFGPGLERYPPARADLLGVQQGAEESDRRIAERFARLLDDGLLQEVRTLAARPAGLSRTARQALGYRELLGHLEEGVPLAEAVDEAVRRTRAFAKRQRAWFRRDPRIDWVAPGVDPVSAVVDAVRRDAGRAGGDRGEWARVAGGGDE